MDKIINILGSSGAVGEEALQVIATTPNCRVGVLAAARNAERLAAQAIELGASIAAIADPKAYDTLKRLLKDYPTKASMDVSLVATESADVVVLASSGISALEPLLLALKTQKGVVAVANKEIFLVAGRLIMEQAKTSEARLIPLDSEHNAVYRVLTKGHPPIRKITLTASGGPFYGFSRKELAKVTPAQASSHPNWSMGAKITVDSATLMNKGIELIEASYLFGVPMEQLDVLVQKSSIIHAVVDFTDGTSVAQLSPPSMKIPLGNAICYPEPYLFEESANLESLSFHKPDEQTFTSIGIAREAFQKGEHATCGLVAADEIAVNAFLLNRIEFLDIPDVVADVVAETDSKRSINSIEEAQDCYIEATQRAQTLIRSKRLAV